MVWFRAFRYRSISVGVRWAYGGRTVGGVFRRSSEGEERRGDAGPRAVAPHRVVLGDLDQEHDAPEAGLCELGVGEPEQLVVTVGEEVEDGLWSGSGLGLG